MSRRTCTRGKNSTSNLTSTSDRSSGDACQGISPLIATRRRGRDAEPDFRSAPLALLGYTDLLSAYSHVPGCAPAPRRAAARALAFHRLFVLGLLRNDGPPSILPKERLGFRVHSGFPAYSLRHD